MRSKLLHEGVEKTFALVLKTGEEASASLLAFAKQNHIGSAHFTAIGGFSNAVLGYFDWEKKQYMRIPVEEQVEVVSIIGDIALEKDAPKIHAHAVLGRRDGAAMGGHLLEGLVRPTLDIVIVESPAHMCRRFDKASGLALIDL